MDTLCLLCWAAESKWSTCLAAAWSLGRTVHLSAYLVDTTLVAFDLNLPYFQ